MPVPSARRTKKSGAWRLALPDSLTQFSHIGCDATASIPAPMRPDRVFAGIARVPYRKEYRRNP